MALRGSWNIEKRFHNVTINEIVHWCGITSSNIIMQSLKSFVIKITNLHTY